MRLILVTAAALTIAACDRAATPAPAPEADPLANAATDLSDAAADLSNEAAGVASSVEADASLPDYLPMPEGGTVSELNQNGGVVTAAILVPGDSAAIFDRYEQAMKDKGLNPARQDSSPGAGQLFSREQGRDIRVTVTKGPAGGALVGIVDRPAG